MTGSMRWPTRARRACGALLEQQSASFKPFWIANAIRIRGDAALLRTVAARPEVAEILATRTYEIPKPIPVNGRSAIDAVEWGIDRIRADEVWSTFGDRGEGIVVANIDTGVQFNHPALVAQYRGNLGGGTFDHNYNWFDPSNVCGSPSLVPCDNNGHGTHTMGTMVGDDGDPGQPDRRRPARALDRGEGLRDEHRARTRLCSPRRPVDPGADRPQRARTRGPTCGRTSSTTRGAAAAATRGTRRLSMPGSPRASSPPFSNGNAGPGCGIVRLARRLRRRATAPARSTSATTSPASRAAGRRPSAAS